MREPAFVETAIQSRDRKPEQRDIYQLLLKFQAVKDTDFAEASGLFARFKDEVEHFMADEESRAAALCLERTAASAAQLTRLMRFEHGQIRALLAGIEEKVRRRIGTTDCELAALRQVNRTIERMLSDGVYELPVHASN